MLIRQAILFRMRIVLLAFFNSITSSWSQCNPPDQIPTNYCETAPLICLLHACYQTIEDNFPDCCGGWCNGDFTIHNPQFFQMIATSTTIEIQISVLGCDDGTGLQGAIIDTCPWATTLDYPNIVECDGDESIGQTMVLLFEEAIIGNSYWLMIDGFGGALCDYEIPFVSGIYNPELVGELDPDESMAIPEVVCQGYQNVTVMASPAIGNAHGYIWVTEWNNETMVTTLPELQFDIPDDAPPGWSTICITPFSGCDTADVPLCVPIFIADVLNGEVDVVHCYNENFDPYYYEGEPYSSSGDYELSYPGMGLAGCDSLANLHLTLIGIDAIIELSCSNGEFVLTPIIQELSPADADIEWSWYEGGSNFVLGNEMSLSVEEDGCYDLFATIETVEGECTFLVGGESFCFNAIEYSPEAPEVNGDTVICAQDDVMFSVTEDPMGEMLQYVWSAPMGVPPFDNGSDTVKLDFTNSTGGQVCVYAINSCGEGPTTCFNVMIQSAPFASINLDGSICKDSAALIQFIGSASANAVFTWNFDNPSSFSGSGIGPYNVTWA